MNGPSKKISAGKANQKKKPKKYGYCKKGKGKCQSQCLSCEMLEFKSICMGF